MKVTKSPSKRRTNIKNVNPGGFLQRQEKIHVPQNTLEIARQRLHVSVIPNVLPFRDGEASDICNFISSRLHCEGSGCMYVAGVPGTGKTATVTQVIDNLIKMQKTEIPEFDYIAINGMKLTEPKRVFVEIYKQLTGKSLVWDQAQNMLTKHFSKKSSKPVVLLLDELDVIFTKKQQVVYMLFDWPTKPNSKLIIVAISNTMDLPERMFMGRVASRLGLTRRPFMPYTFTQLEEIVRSRLEGTEAFQKEAVQLVARKVAAVSGDARRALDICRRAAEIAQNQKSTAKVGMEHVNEALNEMLSSNQVEILKKLPEFQKILLQAIVAEMTRLGVDETSYEGVLKQFQALCTLEGHTQPSYSSIVMICRTLEKRNIIICENTHKQITKLYLNVNQDDLHYAMSA